MELSVGKFWVEKRKKVKKNERNTFASRRFAIVYGVANARAGDHIYLFAQVKLLSEQTI